jgi:hypothetical protein
MLLEGLEHFIISAVAMAWGSAQPLRFATAIYNKVIGQEIKVGHFVRISVEWLE